MNDGIFNEKPATDSIVIDDLKELSVSELKERIKFLEFEIKRCSENIKTKELSKNAANKVFK